MNWVTKSEAIWKMSRDYQNDLYFTQRVIYATKWLYQLQKKTFKIVDVIVFFSACWIMNTRWMFKTVSDYSKNKLMLFLLWDCVTVVLDLVFHLKQFHTTLIIACSICFCCWEAFNHTTKDFVWMTFNRLKSHFKVYWKNLNWIEMLVQQQENIYGR